MRTLHVGLRVADLDRSLAFYQNLGYDVVGTVPETEFGSLTMLKLPSDPFVSLELVHDPGVGTSHPGGSQPPRHPGARPCTIRSLASLRSASKRRSPARRAAPRTSGRPG